MKETDLFEPIKQYFLKRDYEVFSEVLVHDWRADIVARQGSFVVVVELKTQMGLEILEQAERWLHYAHYVYCGIPQHKSQINRYARKCLIRDGIGLLTVNLKAYNNGLNDEFIGDYVTEVIRPRLCRKIAVDWNRFLTEEHKATLPGGSSGGGYITPYKRTMEEVRKILKTYPDGISLDELVKRCRHNHYANKKWGLYQALTKYETSWCETFKEDGKTFFKAK